MKHHIRKGDWYDVAAVMPVMEDAFDPVYGEAWSQTQLSGLLLTPGNWMLLLEVEDQVYGFAVVRSTMDEAELMLLAIQRKMRNRGLGGSLLDAVINECKSQSIRQIYLEMRSDNENALALYGHAGFQPVGRRPGYYRGTDGVLRDAITMALYL
jgi:ribosomal-protein-alanine N-acetyltransferase